MTRKKLAKAQTNYEPITWQAEEYDADDSDLEESLGIPRPLPSSHPNYPLEELELDLEETLITLRNQRTEGRLMPEDVSKLKRIMNLFLRDMNIVTSDINSRFLPPSATCEYREPEPDPESDIVLIVPSSDSEDLDPSSSESDSDSDDLLQVKKGTYRSPMSRNSSGFYSQENTSKSKLPSLNCPRDLPGKAFQTSNSLTSNPESQRKQTRSFKIRKKAIKYIQEEPTAKELCSKFISIFELEHSRNIPRSGRTPGTQTHSFKHHKKKNKSF
ncbi:uncharacterized protein LOC135714704 [Ochlerotatus camptorhynchus]|uniref:uncharacterized protein LOC135714704 n=1 Tax=Ochlerotatus camptorhynchus TaxID=644619 RepID=UPI0031E42C8A